MMITPDMRVVSLYQPFASLLFTQPQVKKHETRPMCAPPAIRGQRIAIHAAKKFVKPEEMSQELLALVGRLTLEGQRPLVDMSFGAIIGTMVVQDSTRMVMPPETMTDAEDIICGDWRPGRWAWRMVDGALLPSPIPYRNAQGVPRYDPERVI